jgi:5-methylcytosine-specific restriction endonuclease McrA
MPRLRFCARPGCPNRVARGRCTACRRAAPTVRASAARRGYGRSWEAFRTVTFPALLLERGVIPSCGARLALGPSPSSECAALGRIVLEGLELDHDPPLTEAERLDPAAVCDPRRVGFLCKSCHTRKTNAERGRGPTLGKARATWRGRPTEGGESKS